MKKVKVKISRSEFNQIGEKFGWLSKSAGMSKEIGFTEKDADPNELKMGIEIEKEHTDNLDKAKEIALDHLSEIKDYYTRLKKMEKNASSSYGNVLEKMADLSKAIQIWASMDYKETPFTPEENLKIKIFVDQFNELKNYFTNNF